MPVQELVRDVMRVVMLTGQTLTRCQRFRERLVLGLFGDPFLRCTTTVFRQSLIRNRDYSPH